MQGVLPRALANVHRNLIARPAKQRTFDWSGNCESRRRQSTAAAMPTQMFHHRIGRRDDNVNALCAGEGLSEDLL